MHQGSRRWLFITYVPPVSSICDIVILSEWLTLTVLAGEKISMDYYGYVLLNFVIGFAIVITHLNLSGKTQLSQMRPVDFIGNFVLGKIIGVVIYSDSIPMYQYVIVLLIGVGMISLLNAISKHYHIFRSVTIGNQIPIIKNGRFLMENILTKQNKIDIFNLSSQLHSQGIHAFQEINYAQI